MGDTAGTTSLGHTGAESGSGMSSRDATAEQQGATTGGDGAKAVNSSAAHPAALGPDQDKSRLETAGGPKAVLSSEGPAPPPFFVAGKGPDVKVIETAPTMRTSDDTKAAEVHEAAQIQGVGNVGEPVPKRVGCKCVLM